MLSSGSADDAPESLGELTRLISLLLLLWLMLLYKFAKKCDDMKSFGIAGLLLVLFVVPLCPFC